MTSSRTSPGRRLRRIVRGAGLVLGLTVVIALALAGAVVGLAVLAIGAAVMRVARALRRADDAAVPRATGAVVDGEYRVVEPGAGRGVRRLTASATNG